jgi:hypothetical protein
MLPRRWKVEKAKWTTRLLLAIIVVLALGQEAWGTHVVASLPVHRQTTYENGLYVDTYSSQLIVRAEYRLPKRFREKNKLGRWVTFKVPMVLKASCDVNGGQDVNTNNGYVTVRLRMPLGTARESKPMLFHVFQTYPSPIPYAGTECQVTASINGEYFHPVLHRGFGNGSVRLPHRYWDRITLRGV